MRSLGEFVGHIVKGIRTTPETDAKRSRTVIRETIEEEQQGDVILRRTTIEEVEVRSRDDRPRDDESPEPGHRRRPRA